MNRQTRGLTHTGTVTAGEVGSSQHGLTHRASGWFRKLLAVALQLFDLRADDLSELAVNTLLGRAVTDAAPREEVRAVAQVKAILITPTDEFQVAVLRFHRLTARIALRICFSC